MKKVLMGIGWDKIGDLNQYGDRNDIKKALKKYAELQIIQ